MSSTDLDRALVEEIATTHPTYSHRGKRGTVPGFTPITRPEPCELCGTRVVAFRSDTNPRDVRVAEIGRVRSVPGRDKPSVMLPEHGRERCRAARAALTGSADDTREGTT